ncbi:MAG TPA: hypothetical protein VGH15_13705 [Caulobacteraceae bacterium]|jgi:hypothetical protein
MESKEMTLVAGGAVVALVVGLGAASWALNPVGQALKRASPIPQVAAAATLPASTQPLAQMPPTEVASLASIPAPAEAPRPDASDRTVAKAETIQHDLADAAQNDGRDAADFGPRTINAPPAERSSRYERRFSQDAPQPYETWRHYEAREPDEGGGRPPPPPDGGPSYPDDPDGG